MKKALLFVSFLLVLASCETKSEVKPQMEEQNSEDNSSFLQSKSKIETDAEMFMDNMAKCHMEGNESGRKTVEKTWEEYLDKLPPEDRMRAAQYAIEYIKKEYPNLH